MSKPGLVPALPSDFSKSAYWESFFKKRVQAFEWYGTYFELCGILHRYIKSTDKILVAGCGNSELSENMYDAGLQTMVNIDISQTVIDQMNKRKCDREMMEYIKMDLTDLQFDEDSFSVIMDKGTLDAVMSDNSAESHETTNKIFSEYDRVLKNGGRYICVTLAQDFILKKILDYFPANGWLVRLHRVFMSDENTSSKFPVFAFVMTKFKNLPKKILEICSDDTFTPTRVENEDMIQEFVTSQQHYAALAANFNREIDPSKDNPSMKLFAANNSKCPRFTMHVVDKASSKPNCKFAVFIVPQGKEMDWQFGTHEGRRKIANQTPFRRLLFVALHPSHEYGERAQLQEELNSTVMDFAPPGTQAADDIPYLSSNTDDMEQRILQFKGQSSFSGEYLVEDFTQESKTWFRHLVFKQRQSIVISEVRLKRAPSSHNRKSGRMKRSTTTVPDHSFLADGYSRAILAGLLLRFSSDDHFKAMMLGVGGGAMSSYMMHNFRDCHMTALEIDKDLVEIGQNWFGLPKGGEGNQFQLHVTDGIDFIYKEQTKFEKTKIDATTDERYDVIIIDIGGQDYTHGIACPTVESAEFKFFKAITKILKDDGFLIMNLLCWDDKMRSKVMYNVRRAFKVIGKVKSKAYYNEVLYCFKQKPSFSPAANKSKSSRKKKKKKQGNPPPKNPSSPSVLDTNTKSENKVENLEKQLNELSMSPSGELGTTPPGGQNLAPSSGDSGELGTTTPGGQNLAPSSGDSGELGTTTPGRHNLAPSSGDSGELGTTTPGGHNLAPSSGDSGQLGTTPPGGQNLAPSSGDCGKNTITLPPDLSILDEKFDPPPSKTPVSLDKYDQNLFSYWRDRTAAWEKEKGASEMELTPIVDKIAFEREVDYHDTT